MEVGDPAGAVPDFERVVRADPAGILGRAQLMLARAYAETGREAEAAPFFAEVIKHSNTPETLYTYAAFLKSQNRQEEARDFAEQLLQKQRTLPRHWERIERPWFRKGQALLKELTPYSPLDRNTVNSGPHERSHAVSHGGFWRNTRAEAHSVWGCSLHCPTVFGNSGMEGAARICELQPVREKHVACTKPLSFRSPPG